MLKLKHLLVTASLAGAAGSLPALAIGVGDSVSALQFQDQHDQKHTLTDDTRLVLLASSHGAAKLVDSAIKDLPSGYLDERSAVYVADISRVPGLVAKMVLVPSMRSANYRVLLDRKGELAPQRTGAEPVLWLTLEDGRVAGTSEFSDPSALRAALEQAE